MKRIIGANIKKLMHRKNISQKRMSDMIGRCENSVHRWVNGVSAPDAEAMYKIAKALRVEIKDLYKGVDDD